jgi:DNA-binding MarR family transcriptional regulator
MEILTKQKRRRSKAAVRGPDMERTSGRSERGPDVERTSGRSERGLAAWLAVVRTYQTCADVLSAKLEPLGIKLAQHDVMVNLLMTPQQTQQQLAANSYVTKSHMSAVLTEMAARGWIARRPSKIDKRSNTIHLTAIGLKLAKRAFAIQAQVVHLMMSPLSDKQMADLERVSRAAGQALRRELTMSQ